MISSILRLVSIIVFISDVLSEPNICQNPKLDSITWVSDQNMWFFTSAGYVWYLSEKDFPPTASNALRKVPEPFTKGTAAVYKNWSKHCKDVKGENVVHLVENIEGSNKILDFNPQTKEFAASPREWDVDHILSQAKIQGKTGDIEAMFSLGDKEIYVVEGQKYAGVHWEKFKCNDQGDWGEGYDEKDKDTLQATKPFDAIAVKDYKMYQFIDEKYWISTISKSESTGGKVVLTKGRNQLLVQFFKCSTTQTPGDKPDDQKSPENQNSENSSDGPNKPSGDGKEKPSDDGKKESGSKGSKESKGSNGWILILVLVIIIVVIAVVVIALFVLRRKSSARTGAAKPVGYGAPKPKAVGAVGKPNPMRK